MFKYYISKGETRLEGQMTSHTIKEVVCKNGRLSTIEIGLTFKLFSTKEEAGMYIEQHFPSSRLRRMTGQAYLAEHQVQRIECIEGAFVFYFTEEQKRKQIVEILKTLPKDKILYQGENIILTNEKVHEWQKPANEGFYYPYVL